MNRTSREVEKRVFEMYYNGDTHETIAHALGLSPTSVSDIISVLPSTLKPTRELSVELRKNNMIARDALKGVKILNHLKCLGLKPEQFQDSIQAVEKMSTDAQYKPESIIQAATSLTQLENQAGKPFPEAIKEFETINRKLPKKKKQHKKYIKDKRKLLQEIDENTRRRDETLEQANVTEIEIAEYKTNKESLQLNGIDSQDPKKLRTYLDNMKETGCDPKRFVAFTEEQGSIKEAIAEAQKENQRTQEERTRLQKCEIQESQKVMQITAHEHQLLRSVQTLRSEVAALEARLTGLSHSCWDLETYTMAWVNVMAKELGIPENSILNMRLEYQLQVLKEQIRLKFPGYFPARFSASYYFYP